MFHAGYISLKFILLFSVAVVVNMYLGGLWSPMKILRPLRVFYEDQYEAIKHFNSFS